VLSVRGGEEGGGASLGSSEGSSELGLSSGSLLGLSWLSGMLGSLSSLCDELDDDVLSSAEAVETDEVWWHIVPAASKITSSISPESVVFAAALPWFIPPLSPILLVCLWGTLGRHVGCCSRATGTCLDGPRFRLPASSSDDMIIGCYVAAAVNMLSTRIAWMQRGYPVMLRCW
jgi:hypothetical protein